MPFLSQPRHELSDNAKVLLVVGFFVSLNLVIFAVKHLRGVLG